MEEEQNIEHSEVAKEVEEAEQYAAIRM